ncbi:arylsulfatase [Mycolicibacterium fluoranthenivorans]|uniref:Arylsulfatase n=1 Tax=Mycolicibacterium fluoranthenivorans TaxID=258505 RepID=A0A7X5U0P7_9MYCO|nr:arylsulfatase [Mycolicibacterium fluoranthenivorans]MCV7357635.1 arylsulfatase [Mycolicibacterium fluoranthenivorans]NIH96255.1 arylsulfatase [Mycolicibacterium fluoranthenivorans]
MGTDKVKARPEAPNVVMIVLDDLGYAQFGCYGSNIRTPAIDRLARNGLRYSRFHVTGLCSPSRAALLTGRNHHSVGMGFLADIPTVHPGYTGKIPDSAQTLPRLLRDSGWSTMAVGKWHLAPRGERTSAGPFTRWPLGLGFERYYGFLLGDANHWDPQLVRDNTYLDGPEVRPDGYHLTEDLTDEAIRMVVSQQQSAPGKPFFLYFATGAMHSPHHVHKDWADAYAGQFDIGWDAWRDEVFARQLAEGVVPAGTTLTPRPDWVPAWATLTADERAVYARMHEVYAGFLSHTDSQIDRLTRTLEELGVMDNTLILVMSDNGASAEGGVSGTSNEHRFTHRVPESLADNLDLLPDWGGTAGYPHYAWGWAWAGNTPFRLWKRYAWLGGTRVPLIVHWPCGIDDGGAVRSQFGHAIDVMPTVLQACGIELQSAPSETSDSAVHGASLLPTFRDAAAPAPRSTQYFEVVGSRSIIDDGWKATTDHVGQGVMDEEALLDGSRDFALDRWSLFRADDFSEAHDVSADHPDVVARLTAVWAAEAACYDVLPLTDSLVARAADMVWPEFPPGQRVVLRPSGGPVVDEALPLLYSRLSADVEVLPEGANGVLFAIGNWTGGLAAFVIESRLHIAIAAPGGSIRVRADRLLMEGRHSAGCRIHRLDGETRVEAVIDNTVVGSAVAPVTLPHVWQHGGTSLRLGRDRGLPVCDSYQPPFAWNGTVHSVTVESDLDSLPSQELLRAALKSD